MKKWLGLFLTAVFLCGCAAGNDPDRAMALRKTLLKSEEVTFTAEITADYGDKLYTFTLDCTGNNEGALSFQVSAPESISGITGGISNAKGRLQFDEEVLAFPLIADDLMSPVSAPWVLYEALRSGYITSAQRDGENLALTISYPYGDEKLSLDVWLNPENKPVRGEILKDGRRYLTVDVSNFAMR